MLWPGDKGDGEQQHALDTIDQWLVKAYWALKHIGYVPGMDDDAGGVAHDETDGDEAPEAAKLLKRWLGGGSEHQNMTPHLKLHAY